ncbi:unnamed protein product, partial [Laminaria digitata]
MENEPDNNNKNVKYGGSNSGHSSQAREKSNGSSQTRPQSFATTGYTIMPPLPNLATLLFSAGRLPSVTSATRQQQLARSLCLDEENRKTSSTAPAGVCRNTVPPPFAANNSPPAGISGSRQRACPLTPPSVCQDMVGGNNNNNNKNNRNGVSNITDKSLGVLCSPSAEGTTVVTIEDFYRARDGESGGSGRSISDRGRGNSGGGGGSGSGSGSGNGGRGG